MWNANFVKMPSSPSSVMFAKSLLSMVCRRRSPEEHLACRHGNMSTRLSCLQQSSQTSRWDTISKKLSALAKKTTASAEDVEVKPVPIATVHHSTHTATLLLVGLHL